MDSESDNYEAIYCADDDEYSIYCAIGDKLCIERFFKNHLKSGSHTNNFSERQRLIITNKKNEINCFH